MRLLVVTQYFWPEDFRINELVAQLVERGHEVTVLTGSPNYPQGTVFPEFRADPARYATYAGAPVERVPMLPRGQGKLRLLLNYIVFAVTSTVIGWRRVSRKQFDAVFVFGTSPVTIGIPAVVFRALRGWPVVFWVLDQWPESLSAVGVVTSERLLAVVGLLVRAIYKRCDLLLSPSRLLIPQIARYARAGQRIEYFPNWSETVYGAGDSAPAPEVPSRPGVLNVMFAGNIGEAQDFPTILDAAERLKARSDIRWLVVGDGRMAAWVREEIERRGLAESVVMLGRFPADRMPSFYQHADALLVALRPHPVFTMTAPGKIQSYLAFGRPVIAMLDGEGAAVIEDAAAGLTCPAGDAEALAAIVVRMAELSPAERARLGANGSAYAQREFSRAGLMDRLEGWLAGLSA